MSENVKSAKTKAKKVTTRKATKIVGTQTYINSDTNEAVEMNVIQIEERDANFHKIWLEHIIHSLDIIGNQKIRLAMWLIQQMNSDNQITMTQRQMAQKSGISLDTVKRTVKSLCESDFLQRLNMGCYAVNPDVIFKGGKTNRLNVLISYQDGKDGKKE